MTTTPQTEARRLAEAIRKMGKEFEALTTERDQLRAQVERLQGGEPVAWRATVQGLHVHAASREGLRQAIECKLGTIPENMEPLFLAQPAAPALVTWQPIETAPKDGTELIGWRDDCGVILIRWTSCDAFMSEREIESSGMDEETLFKQDWFCADFIAGCRLDGSETPTHWMPLPPPPDHGISEVQG